MNTLQGSKVSQASCLGKGVGLAATFSILYNKRDQAEGKNSERRDSSV